MGVPIRCCCAALVIPLHPNVPIEQNQGCWLRNAVEADLIGIPPIVGFQPLFTLLHDTTTTTTTTTIRSSQPFKNHRLRFSSQVIHSMKGAVSSSSDQTFQSSHLIKLLHSLTLSLSSSETFMLFNINLRITSPPVSSSSSPSSFVLMTQRSIENEPSIFSLRSRRILYRNESYP